jgi:hypothetical protein
MNRPIQLPLARPYVFYFWGYWHVAFELDGRIKIWATVKWAQAIQFALRLARWRGELLA